MNHTVPDALDEKLLHSTVKLNTALFAGVCGLVAGCTLLFATYVSLFRDLPNRGEFLNLLGVFLPGYRVSAAGAWIGFAWGCLVGALFGAVMFRVYARGIRQQVAEYLAGQGSHEDVARAILRLDGHSLGVALGSVAAIGLLLTTNWLVVRGTAGESMHAALLGQYLPGYTVSTSGSIVGAAEIFVVAYLACQMLARTYNRVVDWRRKGRGP